MSRQSRQEYFRIQRPRYAKASRAEKGHILDEGCVLLGMHRKALIRALRASGCGKGKAGRHRLYGQDVCEPLKKIWLAAQQPCSKRMTQMLPAWLPFFERHHGSLDPEVQRKLLTASAATIDRLLAPVRARIHRGARTGGGVDAIRGQIPLRRHFEGVQEPGWVEADTVAHCGESMAGCFVWSLTMVDIYSGWTENAATWNRTESQVLARVKDIERRLPFEMQGFDSDNGKEFMNGKLLRYLRERRHPIEVTRSRPYRKNDNAHVEQRQWSHVRQLLGYDRMENRQIVTMLNDLYANEWRALQNFFLPSVHLKEKYRDGARIVRRHTTPQTPYERLMSSEYLTDEQKEKLRLDYACLDPFTLSASIQKKLRAVFRLIKAAQQKKTKAPQNPKQQVLQPPPSRPPQGGEAPA